MKIYRYIQKEVPNGGNEICYYPILNIVKFTDFLVIISNKDLNSKGHSY